MKGEIPSRPRGWVPKGPICSACGYAIDPAAGTRHPVCDPTPDAAQIRRQHDDWIRAGMPPGGFTIQQRALSIIRVAAGYAAELSSNGLREAFDRASIPGPLRGPAWARAVKAGYIEPIGHTPSTGEKTNNHHVQRYRSLIVRPEGKKVA